MRNMLSESQMISVMESHLDQQAARDLIAQLGVPPDAKNAAALAESFHRGDYQAFTVSRHGTAIYQVFYHVTKQNHLYINGSLTLTAADHFDCLIDGIKQFARNKKCIGVVFDTARHGLIVKAQEFEFKVGGVTMILML